MPALSCIVSAAEEVGGSWVVAQNKNFKFSAIFRHVVANADQGLGVVREGIWGSREAQDDEIFAFCGDAGLRVW